MRKHPALAMFEPIIENKVWKAPVIPLTSAQKSGVITNWLWELPIGSVFLYGITPGAIYLHQSVIQDKSRRRAVLLLDQQTKMEEWVSSRYFSLEHYLYEVMKYGTED